MSNVLIPINFDGEQPTGSAGQQKSLVRDSSILSISSLHKNSPTGSTSSDGTATKNYFSYIVAESEQDCNEKNYLSVDRTANRV